MTENTRSAARKRIEAAGTFVGLAQAYMQREAPSWADSHATRSRNRMERDVFPAIGDMPVADIQPTDLARAITAIEERGRQNTALHAVGMISQMLAYAVAKGMATQKFTLYMRGGLDHAPRTVRHAAVTDRAELPHLLRAI